jgi:trimethylamine--corrinoid protein Co-methyltransferase
MPLKGHRCTKPYEILSLSEIERIHIGSLEILEETGMKVHHQRARQILQEAGCEVNEDDERVKFPPELVQWAIDQCPSSFELKARNPEYTLKFGGQTIYFGVFPGFTWLDMDTNERHVATIDDLARFTRLGDALPEAHTFVMPLPHLSDKPPQVEMEWGIATTFRNTEKTVMGPAFGGSSKWVVKMCEVLGQQVDGSICISSPLVIPWDQAQGILDYASANHPLHMLSGPIRGATGPTTMAGTLVQQNVEILAGTVLAQLVRQETGIIYVGYATAMDMRYGTYASGTIDVGIMAVAVAQIARYYGMPSSVFFPMTDSKIPDAQAVYEKHLQTLLCALSGINYIMPLGGLDNEGTHSAIQIVIDNEVCGMIGQVLEGITVDEERLAIELIKTVGPTPGNYLEQEHTRQHWREDYRIPRISIRQGYDTWIASGGESLVARAKAIAQEIMETHKPPPLDPRVDRELDKILQAAEKEKIGN